MEEIHPRPDKYNFKNSDLLLELTTNNSQDLIGHTLVWHNQIPQWVTKNKDGSLVNKSLLLDRIENHIKKVAGRYLGKVKGWDVVNEAIMEDGSFRNSDLYKVLGEEFIYKSFEIANKVDPNAELYYNDYSMYKPKKLTSATVEFTDIAGLVKGASAGEGLGNQFLGQIRETSAIIHVVRCFENENINHVNGKIDPIWDIEIIETELLLSDISRLEKKKEKLERTAKSGNKEDKSSLELIDSLIDYCSSGNNARTYNIDTDLISFKNSLHLLTDKPVLFIGNLGENDLINKRVSDHRKRLTDHVKNQNNNIIYLCASLEQEISLLDKKEQKLFLSEYNLDEPGLNKVIRSSFDLLGLHTFFTCGEKEVRSWTIQKGMKAPQAAGQIHSDFERGFIKAEIFNYKDIIQHKSESKLRDLGLIKQEGRNYIVADGDCIYFKFNV